MGSEHGARKGRKGETMADVNRGNRPLSPHLSIYRWHWQMATSILTRHAVGRSLEEIEAARDALRAMLKDGAEPPDGLFWELRHLQPVREYPPRHISTMLAFDAAVEAMRKALAVV